MSVLRGLGSAINCRRPTLADRLLQTGEQPFGGRGSVAVTGHNRP